MKPPAFQFRPSSARARAFISRGPILCRAANEVVGTVPSMMMSTPARDEEAIGLQEEGPERCEIARPEGH